MFPQTIYYDHTEKYNTVSGFVILIVLIGELIRHLILRGRPYISARFMSAFSGSEFNHWAAEGMLEKKNIKHIEHWHHVVFKEL